MAPAGVVMPPPSKIAIRVCGQFTSEESLKAINFRANGRFFRLGDIAKVTRGYADPPQPMFRYNGKPAIGIALSMAAGGDVAGVRRAHQRTDGQVAATCPSASSTHLVANQPHVVEEAVGEFIKALVEAIAIVLAVSFLALGLRAGIVVAIAIPLVLAITFIVMEMSGITSAAHLTRRPDHSAWACWSTTP